MNFLQREHFPLVLIILLFCFSFQTIAQGISEGYLYVSPTDPSAYPNQQGGVDNPSLQQIFNTFNVVEYVASFPGAQNPLLQNTFEIHCDGDIHAFQDSLEQTNLFNLIEYSDYYELTECPTTCGTPYTVNDPYADYQFESTQANCAWTITEGDSEVVIAVVDTYFDTSNDDLDDGQIVSTWGSNTAHHPHGTLTAGMIVATPNNNYGTAGLAPNIKVAGYSVETSGNFGSPWPGIWRAYLDGHKIINVSWSGTGGLTEAIEEIVANGTLLVVSAGNGDPGQSTPHDRYADIPGVIMVSSVSADGSVHEWVDYNEHVDLCAPGNGVGCLVTNKSWGTSMSAPAVSAAAGLLLSVNQCLSPDEIENILKMTACPMIPHPQVDPNWIGAGSLNIYQAVLAAKGRFGVISGNEQPWEDMVYVSEDLIVSSGVTLTINGTVKFSEGAGLIIEPGAKVILNGKLTSSCSNPWNGITINGLATESQMISGNHGSIITNPGAIIENATIGVKLVDGGYIRSDGTLFQNNGIGIEYYPYSNFYPYPYPEQWTGQPKGHYGGIVRCEFIVNDNFQYASEFSSFIQMNGVRGIRMSGCTFRNERQIENPTGFDSYGYGIKATDSRFTVESKAIGRFPQTQYEHSEFFGLGYGIYVGSAQSPSEVDFVNVPYVIKQANFTNCISGVHNRFVSQGIIIGNSFNMGNLQPVNPLSGNSPFTNIQIGVFFENGANGFEIQENNFNGSNGNVDYTFGTYCQNLGWFNNAIRLNTYDNVSFGNVAEYDNAQINPARGLHYLCNDNSNDLFDFYVFPNSDIRKHQGIIEYVNEFTINRFAAENLFTGSFPPDGDFSNNGPNVQYYYSEQSMKPTYFSNLSFRQTIFNPCESMFCYDPCLGVDEAEHMKRDFDELNDEYNGLIFNGDSIIELKAAAIKYNLDYISNKLLEYSIYDTITYSLSEVRKWCDNMDSPISTMNLARDYYKNDQRELAISLLDEMPQKFPITSDASLDIQDYKSIMIMLDGLSANDIPSKTINYLLHIANTGSGISAAWSKNILTLHGYHFPPVPTIPSGKYSYRLKGQTVMELDNFIIFSVYPNPTRDFIYLKNNGYDTIDHEYHLTLHDTRGKIVYEKSFIGETAFPTFSLDNGIYYYQVNSEYKKSQTGILTVFR